MRIGYDSTLDDYVEFSVRAWDRSQRSLRWWRRDPVIGAVLTAGIFYLGARPPVTLGLLWAGIGLVAGSVAYPRYRRWRVQRSSRSSFSEWFAGQSAIRNEMEPRTNGFWVRQRDGEMLFPWNDFVTIRETGSGDVELDLRNDGFVLVRARAFENVEQRSAFVAAVRERWAAAGAFRSEGML